jgi:hypothetical protein
LNSLSRTIHASERNTRALALVGAWLAILLATAMAAFGAGIATAELDYQWMPLFSSMRIWILLLMVVGFIAYLMALALLARRTLVALRGDGYAGGA